jgi:hypothetical protein
MQSDTDVSRRIHATWRADSTNLDHRIGGFSLRRTLRSARLGAMSRRPSVLTAAIAVAAVAALGACGSTVAAPGTTAPTSSAPATTTGASPSSAPASSAPAADDGGDFCGTVRKNVKFVTTGGMSGLIAGGTPSAWKAYLKAAVDANQQLVDAAPSGIRPAMRTLQKDSDLVGSLMADAGYDPSKVDSGKLVKAVTSSEHAAATKTLVTYVKASCGLDLTKLSA